MGTNTPIKSKTVHTADTVALGLPNFTREKSGTDIGAGVVQT